MSFFKGEETYSVDDKGRVNIPAKMRKVISPEANDTFVFTRGNDSCVIAYPLDEWQKHEEKFKELNQYDEKNRFFLRMILKWSEEVSLDRQSRVMMPKKHIRLAGISSKVTIIGMGDHLEFWEPEACEKYFNEQDESFETVSEKVMNI
jgi:transcriptional regulator MraZ